ncbi:hypothetical protein H1C71_041186, partial [Ictidomys tridecemlineatus]
GRRGVPEASAASPRVPGLQSSPSCRSLPPRDFFEANSAARSQGPLPLNALQESSGFYLFIQYREWNTQCPCTWQASATTELLPSPVCFNWSPEPDNSSQQGQTSLFSAFSIFTELSADTTSLFVCG